jgi:hypothetical protein
MRIQYGLFACLLLLAACNLPPIPGTGPDPQADGGIRILDAGLDGEGEPAPAEGEAGEGEAGEGEGSGFEYTGEAEAGVRCGAALEACASAESCCVTLSGTATCDDTCGDAVPVGCDGDEDCLNDDVCCIDIVSATTQVPVGSSCRAASACAAADTIRASVSSADCAEGQKCCSVNVPGLSLPIDVGGCLASCDVTIPTGP